MSVLLITSTIIVILHREQIADIKTNEHRHSSAINQRYIPYLYYEGFPSGILPTQDQDNFARFHKLHHGAGIDGSSRINTKDIQPQVEAASDWDNYGERKNLL